MWVISCQVQLGAFWHAHSHSGPIGLTDCGRFHARSSWVPSDHAHSHSGPCWLDRLWVISCQVQLGAFWLFSLPLWSCWVDRKWVMHAGYSWMLADCVHTHSGPVGLTDCEWFHGRFSWVPFDCAHSPPWSCWPDREWVISCQVQLGDFWLFSLPLWSYWLDSQWVISCQVQLGAFWLCLLPLWSCHWWLAW